MASSPAMSYKPVRGRLRLGRNILDPKGFAMPARLARPLAAKWLLLCVLTTLYLLGCGPALAAAPYVGSGVPVDVTAADAATARDQAIVEGQRKAFSMLMQQLLGAENGATIQTPPDSQLSAMVQ